MRRKITLVGEALIDFISNKSGKLKDIEIFEKKIGGAPLNVAYIISSISNSKPIFLGSVGNDSFGESIIEKIGNYIDTSYIKKSNLPTTLAFVSLDKNGERSFEFFRGADSDYKISDIPKEIENSNIFHFGSATAFLDGDLKDTYFNLLKYCIENKKFISFDPNYRDALFKEKESDFIESSKIFLKNANIIKLSEEELNIITKEKEFNKAKNKIKLMVSKESYLIITLGSKGSILIYDYKEYNFDAKKVKIIDSTGAGDAFIGSLITQINELNEYPKLENLKKFIKISSLYGGFVASKKGAQIPLPKINEINNFD